MSRVFSVRDLRNFLIAAERQRTLSGPTSSALRATCERVLGKLSDEAQRDVLRIDFDEALSRFAKENPQVTAGTVKVYASRIKSAIRMMAESGGDPQKLGHRRSKTAVRSDGADSATLEVGSTRRPAPEFQRNPNTERHWRDVSGTVGEVAPGALNYPFPLREDLTIMISNIPRDLRISEVDRLAQFLKALALGDKKP